MLTLPICGFARRVDDTVARAMAILNAREDYTIRPPTARPSTSAPKPQRFGH
ncbi:hypothetical protein [Microvirga calopogonii]|uniref:hypothetical protein n=1 Tax=Microvirga calopogonii TaxID=2078013 RepID=UPI0013B435D7|nr:hypothetical protein [Microvirga calopogonii]